MVNTAGAFFTTYEATRSLLGKLKRPNTHDGSSSQPWLPQPLINAAASSVGEIVACLILTPAEVLKQNAQMEDATRSHSHSQSSHHSSSPQKPNPAGTNPLSKASPAKLLNQTTSLRALRRFKHPSQLWRGYGALVARNLPFTALQFPLFEHLKSVLFARRDAREKDPTRRGAKRPALETAGITALSASLAGAVAAVVTTPVDVVKTRIMLAAGDDAAAGGGGGSGSKGEGRGKGGGDGKKGGSGGSGGSGGIKGKKSAWAVGKDILRNEGFKTLWRGGALRAVWTALGSGLYLGAYETGRTYLEDRRDGLEDKNSL